MPKTTNDIPISKAIRELVDTIEWTVTDDYDLSTINWHDTEVTQPTDDAINAKRLEMANAFNATEYKDLRVNGEYELQPHEDVPTELVLVKVRDGYPSIEEQLDYIYHNGIEAWKTDVINPVKTRFPKPD